MVAPPPGIWVYVDEQRTQRPVIQPIKSMHVDGHSMQVFIEDLKRC
jgi:hypothetical protein